MRILWNYPPPETYRWLKGFQRLQLLVRHEGRVISSHQLQQLSEGATIAVDDSAEFETIVDGFHPSDTGRLEPVMTNEQRKAYRQRLTDLDLERAQAMAQGNTRRARDCESRHRAINELLRKATGLNGRLRPDPNDPMEKARKNISRTVNDAIDLIAEYQPDLAAHFSDTLHLGLYCSYHPDPPRHWQTAA